jgi:hypothetical protein
MAWMIGLFEAIKNRWNDKNLDSQVPGSISQSEPPERTARIYAVAKPLTDTKNSVAGYTNKGRYRDFSFTIDIAADKWEDLDDPSDAVITALEEAPLTISKNRRLVKIRQDGDITFLAEDQLQRAVIGFKATIAGVRATGQ